MILAQPWPELLLFIKSLWPHNNYVTSNWQEVSNGFFIKRCTCCPISLSYAIRTYNIEICQSYMTELLSRTSRTPLAQWSLSKNYDNFMPAAYLRVQIRNSMPSRKKSLWKNFSHHGWPSMKILVFWIVIRTQKCFERRFTLSALLIVFHCVIWLLITFQFTALPIAFSK